MILRTLVKSNLKFWDQLPAYAEFAYNKAPSKTIGMFPFKVVYGVEPVSPFDVTLWPMEVKLNV